MRCTGENADGCANVSGHVLGVEGIAPNAPLPAPGVERVATPMRQDLERRLAELRANGPKNPYPKGVNGERQLPWPKFQVGLGVRG
jgi:hypothetical protein